MNNNEIVNGWVEFIDQRNWDIFLTITFRRITRSPLALKSFKWFFKHLNTTTEEYFRKFIYTLIFFENNPERSGVHIHAFIEGISPSTIKLLEKKCTDFFGLTDVKVYDPIKGGKFYLSKKIIDRNLDDYNYYKINSRLRNH